MKIAFIVQIAKVGGEIWTPSNKGPRSLYDYCRQNWRTDCVCWNKTEDPSAQFPSLESQLEAITAKNDKILTSAKDFINSADVKVSEFQEPGFPLVLEFLHWMPR